MSIQGQHDGDHEKAVWKKLCKERRSIRIFTSDPVPDSVVRSCLMDAISSPSSSNLQPWQFYRIRARKEEAIPIFMGQTAARTASEIVVVVARPDLWDSTRLKILDFLKKKRPAHLASLEQYYQQIVPEYHTGGWVGWLRYLKTMIRALKRPMVREGYRKSSLQERAVKSAALACQNFMMAIQAHGYHSCPMEGFDSARLSRLLGLPPSATIVMGIAIGYASPSYECSERMRLDFDEVVFEV